MRIQRWKWRHRSRRRSKFTVLPSITSSDPPFAPHPFQLRRIPPKPISSKTHPAKPDRQRRGKRQYTEAACLDLLFRGQEGDLFLTPTTSDFHTASFTNKRGSRPSPQPLTINTRKRPARGPPNLNLQRTDSYSPLYFLSNSTPTHPSTSARPKPNDTLPASRG